MEEEALTHRQRGASDVWYWQGDGKDFPESLACPVIMQPETVRELLKIKQAVERVRGICQVANPAGFHMAGFNQAIAEVRKALEEE